MRKGIVRVLVLLAVCVALTDTAGAVDSGSLLYRNSFGLYYLEDPFDLTLNPAFLHQIDRWRLFTNLSNYEDANSFLVGTSGRLGPGSLGLFYETEHQARADEIARSTDQTTDDPSWTGDTPNDTLVTSESDARRYEEESSRHAFVASYGMNFTNFSLGVSYRPSFSSESVTLHGSIDERPDYDRDPLSWSRPSFAADLLPGWNYSEAWRETRYDGRGRVISDEAESESFEGDAEADEERHGLEVGSQLRFFKSVPVWVRLGAQSVKRTVDGSGTYAFSRTVTRQGSSNDVFTISESRSSTWSGDAIGGPDNHAFDGTEWSLEVVPRYAASSVVTLEFGLGYKSMEGDVTGRWAQDVLLGGSQLDTGATQTWQGAQHIANTFSGDGDTTAYSVAPRVYLTYGAVEFALGVGYSRSEDEVSGVQQGEGTMSWAYDDGAAGAGDWTSAGNSTSRSERSFSHTATEVSFPVATKFRVTDRLELRAGARHVQTTTETESRSATREDERFTITDGAGNIVRQGPASRGTEVSERLEATTSATSYRLGAGYRATDHLQFDLLFSQTKGDGVDTTVVHASAVLAF